MELREPKKKQREKPKEQMPFPIPINGSQEEWPMYTAHLTDIGACIIEPDQIRAGYFGKGSLSRGNPIFGKARFGAPPVVQNRQWYRRQEWMKDVKELNAASSSTLTEVEEVKYNNEDTVLNDKEENSNDIIEIPSTSENGNKTQDEINTISKDIDEVVLDSAEEDDICVIANKDSENCDTKLSIEECSIEEEKKEESSNLSDYYDFKNGRNNEEDIQGKLLVLPDSDSDTENYLENIKPRIEDEGFPVREALHLTFEETFFLLFGLGCLQLVNFDGNLMDIDDTWLYFNKRSSEFLQKYVVYHYYRSKGWVVKPGFKYGGDFLLYKHGPPFHHASFIVIIEVVDADTLLVDTAKTKRTMTWEQLYGFNRQSEATAKETLFAQVLWPSSVPQDISNTSPDILSEFTVREVHWRRWNPKQHREDVTIEEDDDDDDDDDSSN
ncbi:tRNA-splicing endonuclease subunit Sen2 isoform X2 [Pseudomyrmex gracilis]|uniref:tRNA-splicing endonuclease subunit Sen2 isoform X2 n=1 Tax=Pseudomyrmex gracilis TaxID=219809 RepID=UPI0009957B7D|nr:tRNA-splicing endonuclease subunit Sen2 isoform X2 [Pseudomyrmex gracilis]